MDILILATWLLIALFVVIGLINAFSVFTGNDPGVHFLAVLTNVVTVAVLLAWVI